MGFGTIGHPIGYDEATFRSTARMYFNTWLYELNYENYIENVYPIETLSYSQINPLLINTLERIEHRRTLNKHILWELKTITGLRGYISELFDAHSINDYGLIDSKTNIEAWNPALKGFINKYKNAPQPFPRQSDLIVFEFIDSLTEIEVVYLFIVIYIDLSKIENFLMSQYDYGITESQVSPLALDKSKLEPVNPHPEIFTSYAGYKLFEVLRDIFMEEDAKLGFSFIYRMLQKENLIIEHCTVAQYVNFIGPWAPEVVAPIAYLEGPNTCNSKNRRQLLKMAAKLVNITLKHNELG